jgi:phage terminase small subunit
MDGKADKNVNIKGGDGNKVGELRIGFEDNENPEE